MKKITTLILLSMFTLSGFSQAYFKLIKEDKSWNVLNVVLNGIGPPIDTTYFTTNYIIGEDSILNNIEYKKLFTFTQELPNRVLKGLIREDSTRKVWYKRIVDENEVLLYDFSLVAGDSLKIGFDTLDYYYVDSVTTCIINGNQRRKYWISDYDWQETWIEGIGSNRGIINSASATIVGGWSWLLCVSDSGELIYSNPNFESCYLVDGIDELEDPVFHIYPNPAKNLLNINNSRNNEIESILLINVSGKIIKRFDSRKTRLDISDINSGLYFLRVFYKNGEWTTKIIIE